MKKLMLVVVLIVGGAAGFAANAERVKGRKEYLASVPPGVGIETHMEVMQL